MRRLGLVLVAALVAGSAGQALAQAQHKPPSFSAPAPKLRGPEAPAKAPAPLPARPADQSLDPLLAPPVDTTARMGGLEQERAGGAICRQACAQSYYFCLTNEDAQSCATSWTTCLTACPTNSSRQ
jgi:hypothetical protein